MEKAPRLALLPGLALTITVYCLNMFGDAVRDLIDPRLRGGERVRGGRRRGERFFAPTEGDVGPHRPTLFIWQEPSGVLPTRAAKPIQPHCFQTSGRCLHNQVLMSN